MIVIAVVEKKSSAQPRHDIRRIDVRDDETGIGRVEIELLEDLLDPAAGDLVDCPSSRLSVENGPPWKKRGGLKERDCRTRNITFGSKPIDVPACPDIWLEKEKLHISRFSANDLLFSRFEIIPLDLGEPDDLHRTSFRTQG